jgi:hypothetical protein
MILEFGNNQNKPGRCRYFEMRINLGITGPKAMGKCYYLN